MKKIGLLTINDNNYGNRLQNYALQETLKKYNCKVYTIHNQKSIYGINSFKMKVKDAIKYVLNTNKYKRYNSFTRFNKNIKFSNIFIDENHIDERLNNKYDCFFTGSDQVWNPTFGRMSDIDFLTFADKIKRNSISASFGISKIPDNLKEYYIKRLEGMNNISVREDRGKEIIEELTGRKDIVVLVDPTMMLSQEEWEKVIIEPNQIKKMSNKKFILNYFLGELSVNRKKEIERIAQENECEIINILDPQDPFYVSGPSEFLWFEKNAFLICTDSFHSAVFAILFNKPFIVFNREDKEVNMNSRLETLLTKFELKDRYYKGKISDDLLKINSFNTSKILDIERKKVNDFIIRCIKN